MKFLSYLNIYKRLNYGEINVCKISILLGIIIVIVDMYLAPFFSSIIIKILANITQISIDTANILIFIGNFIGATISLLLITIILGKSKSSVPITRSQLPENSFYNAALLIIGFRIFYEGSISHITNLLPMPQSIVNAFDKISISPIYLMLSVCVFAPFIEEFMYRGILLNGFLKKYSPKTAIILSALFFAIAHMNLPQGINAFILGVVLATIYYKTHSIYLCIFMHFINNLCAQFIFLLCVSTTVIIIQSIIFIIIGGLLIYKSLKGLRIIV